MKILAMVHGFPPHHNAGAEWMLHDMLKYLKEKGHQATVMLPITGLKPYEISGIRVLPDSGMDEMIKELNSHDIVISHLDRYAKALNRCEYFGKPYILLVHNTHRYAGIAEKHKREMNQRRIYVIYNSEYTRDALKYPNPAIIVHPPVDKGRVLTRKTRAEYITLINLFAPKGGDILPQIARALPEKKFLGVKGGYGHQVIDENIQNITYMENTPDIKKIYGKTRILIMPSEYESYGRTAVEAMINGIPVVANNTPGLKESLSYAGVFVNDRGDVQEWREKILEVEGNYKSYSDRCKERAEEIQKKTEAELQVMEEFILKAINKKL